MYLTRCDQANQHRPFDDSLSVSYGRPGLTCDLLSEESRPIRFETEEGPNRGAALNSCITLFYSFDFARSGPFHGRSILGGEYMAI